MSKKWVAAIFVVALCVTLCVTVGVLYAAETQKKPHVKPAHKKPALAWASFKPVENDYRVIGFGSHTLLTCTVMANRYDKEQGKWDYLYVDKLFADDTTAVYVLGVWLKNLNDIKDDGTFDMDEVTDAKAAVTALMKEELFKTKKYKELYDKTLWTSPTQEVQDLEDAGVQLPFVHWTKDTNALKPVIDGLKEHGFGKYDLPSLMFTPADPQVFDDDAVKAVEKALHSADCILLSCHYEDRITHEVKGGIPDIAVEHKTAGYQYRVPWPGNNPLCCNRTTRICGQDNTKVCTTCGAICCLGSQWCSP